MVFTILFLKDNLGKHLSVTNFYYLNQSFKNEILLETTRICYCFI
jgi:hypothetical protein